MSSAAALSLPMTVVGKLEQALAAGGVDLPKVIWLNGANCTGCTVSLANLFSDTGPTDVADLLLNTISLAYHPTLMGAAGDLAIQQLKETAQESYILAVDGGIPTAFNGHTCLLWTDQGHEVTAMEAIEMLAPNAAAILSIGTCASYGGMPAGEPNPTGIVGVDQLAGNSTVNIPGCPTHPDWIVWTIAHLLAGEMPALDEQNRPVELYGREIHKQCPYREGEEAKTFGSRNSCLKELGCKGEKTGSDCPSRKWNNGINWCIGAGSICIGCTEKGFPDSFAPFYKVEYRYEPFEKQAPTDPPTDTTQPDPLPETGSGSLSIKEAVWKKEGGQLTVNGEGPAGQIVTLYEDTSSRQFGAVTVDQEQRWKFRQRRVRPAPTRLKAVCGSLTAFSNVKIEG